MYMVVYYYNNCKKSYTLIINEFNKDKIHNTIQSMVFEARKDAGYSDSFGRVAEKKSGYMQWRVDIELLLQQNNKDLPIIFEPTWNLYIKNHIVQSICGLANEEEIGGGYIIIGIEEFENKPSLPPRGLNEFNLKNIKKDINKACRQIRPKYPYTLDIVSYKFHEKDILILPVFLSYKRPHSAPENVNEANSNYKIYKYSQILPPIFDTNTDIIEQDMALLPEQSASDSNEKSFEGPPLANSSVPTFSFYKKGDFWLIGKKDNEVPIRDLLGLSFIHFLLERPNTFFPSEVVSSSGENPGTLPKEESYQEKFDDLTESQIKGSIEELREEIEFIKNNQGQTYEYEDSLPFNKDEGLPFKYVSEIEDLEKTIQQYEKYLKDGKLGRKKLLFRTKQKERPRVNVYKCIDRALTKIIVEIGYLETYLNKHTIITGDNLSYKPLIENSVEWILYPPEPPSV